MITQNGELPALESPRVADSLRSVVAADEVAAAVRRELQRRSPMPVAVRVRGAAVVVAGLSPVRPEAVVAAAVEDDGNPGRVVLYAVTQAHRHSVPLRVIHVWTGGIPPCPGVRMCRHDRMSDADRLLSAILYDHLPAESADAAEREILHDRDPVRALTELSTTTGLLVIGARSSYAVAGEVLGDTARALIGRTACPLALLPAHGEPVEPVPPCTW